MKTIYACLLMAVCLPLPAVAQNSLSECAGIESAVARLECFDRLASEKQQRTGTQPDAAPGERAEPDRDETPAPAAAGTTPPGTPSQGSIASFGKKKEIPEEKIDHITARIDSVRKSPLGQHIFTLSNGQIWMQNEPGRRSIRADQDVTIRKHRWHYEMELESGPDVPVHRVD